MGKWGFDEDSYAGGYWLPLLIFGLAGLCFAAAIVLAALHAGG